MAKLNELDFIGKKFGQLTIISFTGRDIRYAQKVLAKCDCGVLKEFLLANIAKPKAKTKSCGCFKSQLVSQRMKTHGLSHHRLRGIYDGIKDRCYNPNNKCYYLYGGRGVVMCNEWKHDFKSFYDWCIANGWQKGMHIDKDKIQKESGISMNMYSPVTCTILSGKENLEYVKRVHWIEYNGKSMPIQKWCSELSMPYSVLYYRLKICNWDMSRALDSLKKRYKRK